MSIGKRYSVVPVQSVSTGGRKIRLPGPKIPFLNGSRLHLQYATALQRDDIQYACSIPKEISVDETNMIPQNAWNTQDYIESPYEPRKNVVVGEFAG